MTAIPKTSLVGCSPHCPDRSRAIAVDALQGAGNIELAERLASVLRSVGQGSRRERHRLKPTPQTRSAITDRPFEI
jgi:hypothetical protein